MEDKAGSRELVLRPARAEDESFILSWRNDPYLAAFGTDGRTIGTQEHARWFRSGLADPARWLQIIEIGGQPAGCVRFDRVDGPRAIISIGLFQPYIGLGVGTNVIRQATAAISRDWGIPVIACVRKDNARAKKAFIRAGYVASRGPSVCPAGQCSFVAAEIDA